MIGAEIGHASKMVDIQSNSRTEYSQLSPEDKEALVQEYTMMRASHPSTLHVNAKSRIADVTNTIRNMQLLVRAIAQVLFM